MIGERLKELRKQAGMTQVELGNKLHCGGTAISQYEKDVRNPDNETLMKIAYIFDVSTDYLLGSIDGKNVSVIKSNEKKGVRIPVLGEIHAGIPIEAITDIIDYEDISAEMAAGGEYFGLRVKGDSMMPVLLDGDTIIVRQQPEVENGETAIISIGMDEATVKKVKKNEDGSVMIIPNNPAYETMYFTKEQVIALPVRVLGKVVEIRRKL